MSKKLILVFERELQARADVDPKLASTLFKMQQKLNATLAQLAEVKETAKRVEAERDGEQKKSATQKEWAQFSHTYFLTPIPTLIPILIPIRIPILIPILIPPAPPPYPSRTSWARGAATRTTPAREANARARDK